MASQPRYFDVDGTLVKLEFSGDEVLGLTSSGKPFPIGKALSEGKVRK